MDGDGDGSKEPPSAAAGEEHLGGASKPQSTVAGLAKEAAQLFHTRSYQGCLLILHQLQLLDDEDPKVSLSRNAFLTRPCLANAFRFSGSVFGARTPDCRPVLAVLVSRF